DEAYPRPTQMRRGDLRITVENAVRSARSPNISHAGRGELPEVADVLPGRAVVRYLQIDVHGRAAGAVDEHEFDIGAEGVEALPRIARHERQPGECAGRGDRGVEDSGHRDHHDRPLAPFHKKPESPYVVIGVDGCGSPFTRAGAFITRWAVALSAFDRSICARVSA